MHRGSGVRRFSPGEWRIFDISLETRPWAREFLGGLDDRR
jgi:hypothetical protein